MKRLKIFIVFLIIIIVLTIIAITATNIIVKRQMNNDVTGKIVFERGETADDPAGIYLYDFESKKTERLILNGFTDLGNISGYNDGNFYCSGRSADQKTYYILKVEELQVKAKIPVISSPFAVKKYGDTAIYVLDKAIYLANFDKATSTVLIKDVMSENKVFTPLYVYESKIVFARQKKLDDESIDIWLSSQQELTIPVDNYPTYYTYDNGNEKIICSAKECFGFVNDEEVLIRDTKNRMKRINIETGKIQFVRYTKYDTPSAISPDGKYMVCSHLPGYYDERYLVHLKTGVNIITNDFSNVASMEWIK